MSSSCFCMCAPHSTLSKCIHDRMLASDVAMEYRGYGVSEKVCSSTRPYLVFWEEGRCSFAGKTLLVAADLCLQLQHQFVNPCTHSTVDGESLLSFTITFNIRRSADCRRHSIHASAVIFTFVEFSFESQPLFRSVIQCLFKHTSKINLALGVMNITTAVAHNVFLVAIGKGCSSCTITSHSALSSSSWTSGHAPKSCLVRSNSSNGHMPTT